MYFLLATDSSTLSLMPVAPGDPPPVVGGEVALNDFSTRDPVRFERALRRSGLAVADSGETARWRLDVHGGCLALVPGFGGGRPLVIDLSRPRRGVGRGDLLRRAVGKGDRRVVDATAGLGSDMVHLARIGYRVVAVERHPALFALLADAVDRIPEAAVRESIELLHGDSRELLPGLEADVVYLDPMFRRARQGALPRREMVVLDQLAGAPEADDAPRLLAAARAACRRVVVKRADGTAPLAPGRHHCHSGKTVRYDVYLSQVSPG
jgi:16S rRNA (guanine1516-N2)-methyltransferase